MLPVSSSCLQKSVFIHTGRALLFAVRSLLMKSVKSGEVQTPISFPSLALNFPITKVK